MVRQGLYIDAWQSHTSALWIYPNSDLAIVGCLSSILFQLTHHLWGPSLHCIWTYAWSLPQLQPSLWSDCYPQAAPVPRVCRLERQPLLLCVSMEIYQIKKCNNLCIKILPRYPYNNTYCLYKSFIYMFIIKSFQKEFVFHLMVHIHSQQF